MEKSLIKTCERPTFKSIVKGKDGQADTMEIVVARVNVRDLDGDIFLPGSYKTKESGPFMMSFHHSRSTVPVGIGPVKEDGEEVIQSVEFFTSDLAKATFEAIEKGKDSVEFSYTFWPLDYSFDDKGIIFKEVEMYETSPVLKGASINTGVKESAKSLRNAFVGKLEPMKLAQLKATEKKLIDMGIVVGVD